MKVQHTPGPWQVKMISEQAFEVQADSPHIPGKIQRVCEINGPFNSQNYKANARLIAAVPEMLECLEQALAYKIPPTLETYIKSVIARAKGEV